MDNIKETRSEVKKLFRNLRKELSELKKKEILENEKSDGDDSSTLNTEGSKPTENNSLTNESDNSPFITARNKTAELFKEDSESQSCKDMKFLNINASQSIDENIKQLRLDLKKSYDLFINTRDTLQSINFGNLKGRIQDLHIRPSDEEIGIIINNRPIKNNIEKLTKYMAGKFGEHPGEFGDIPELKVFYRACSQLESGMDQLNRQQNDFSDLAKRMQWATKVSDNRSNEIQNLLKKAENI